MPRSRIGLLSPYSGTNLGDGAIHAALIANLKDACGAAALVGINLSPQRTSALHGIDCYPITGLPVTFYSEALFAAPRTPAPQRPAATERSWAEIVREAVKGTAGVRTVAKAVLRGIRSGRGWVSEFRALFASYGVVKQLTLLIIAGGGQIDEEWGGAWGHPYTLFRWALLARLAGTPVVFVSVGASPLRNPLSRLFVRIALASAAYRSYRDADSKELLRNWTFTTRDVCVPDLAFSLSVEQYGRRPWLGGRRVAISPISFGHPDRWPTPRRQVYEHYVRELAHFTSDLLGRGVSVVLINSSGSDRQAIRDLLDLVGAVGDRAAAGGRVRVVNPVDVDTLLAELSDVDLVVASRLHGVLLSHLLLKPVVAISFDRKVETHMRDIDQSTYLTDIHDVSSAQLAILVDQIARTQAAVRATLERRIDKCRDAVRAQYRILSALVASSARSLPAR